MAKVHRELADYCTLPDPLFLLRYLTGEERGREMRTTAGRYRPTDNSPAWLMHYLAFNGIALPKAESLEPLMAEWPCHMFELARLGMKTVSHHGWHVAHFLPAKDRSTSPERWTRADLVRRFVRNVHPCNYSYLPKPDWARYGADPAVISFLTQRYRERYRDVWDEFAALAEMPPPSTTTGAESDGVFRYQYQARLKAPGGAAAPAQQPFVSRLVTTA